MDPLTQGVVGTVASQIVAKPSDKIVAAVLGFLSGMAADLDVLIRSNTDPLLALEYHRQFTHALVFIPFGALICSLVFYRLFLRDKLSFKLIYLFCLLGYATHALLDACTTYGTQLFWPFSNARVAWNNVSVVDPLFTIPLLLLIASSVVKRSNRLAAVSLVYAFAYLGFGVMQNHRAFNAAQDLAVSRGHQAINLGVKPSFANLVVWKSVYEFEGRYYVDAVRAGTQVNVVQGMAAEKLDLAKHFSWLKEGSQQAKDVERFRWFSNQHLGVDPDNSSRIIDIRYSLIPNQVSGMWGIVLDPMADAEQHVEWTVSRPVGEKMRAETGKLWRMLIGS